MITGLRGLKKVTKFPRAPLSRLWWRTRSMRFSYLHLIGNSTDILQALHLRFVVASGWKLCDIATLLPSVSVHLLCRRRGDVSIYSLLYDYESYAACSRVVEELGQSVQLSVAWGSLSTAKDALGRARQILIGWLDQPVRKTGYHSNATIMLWTVSSKLWISRLSPVSGTSWWSDLFSTLEI